MKQHWRRVTRRRAPNGAEPPKTDGEHRWAAAAAGPAAKPETASPRPPKSWRTTLAMTLILFNSIFYLCGFSLFAGWKNEQGNKEYKKGKIGKAKANYQQALKSDPKSPAIAFNLGNAYYKEESFGDSLKLYKQAAEDPRSPLLQSKAFYNLGNSLVRRNDRQKAIEFFKQALRLDPKDEDAKYNLELLLKQENRKDQQQKEDQKKEKKPKNEDKKDQEKQPQGGQGQPQGSEGQKEEKPEGGQGQENKSPQGQGRENEGQQDKEKQSGQSQDAPGSEEDKDQKPEDQKEGQGSPSEKQKERESKEEEERKSGGRQSEEKKEEEQKGEQSAGQKPEEKEGEEKDPEPQPKSAEEMRAEQLLEALEGQEKQVLRQSSQKNPQARARRVVEKDW